jgi:hypothetical protein
MGGRHRASGSPPAPQVSGSTAAGWSPPAPRLPAPAEALPTGPGAPDSAGPGHCDPDLAASAGFTDVGAWAMPEQELARRVAMLRTRCAPAAAAAAM